MNSSTYSIKRNPQFIYLLSSVIGTTNFTIMSQQIDMLLIITTSRKPTRCMRIYNYFITWYNVCFILQNILEIIFLKLFFISQSLQIYYYIIFSLFEKLRCINLIDIIKFFFWVIKDRNTILFFKWSISFKLLYSLLWRERERENNHLFLGENMRQITKLYKRRWVEEYSKENV